MKQMLTVSPSPHAYGSSSVNKLMYGVLIALVPAFVVSLIFYGIGALIVTLTAVAACVLTEYVIARYLLKTDPSIVDGSAAITGVLLAFNVPSNLPIFIIILGAIVSIGIGKMSFGGLGNNPFNPALIGRVFLLISFPVQMTTWPVPVEAAMSYVDAVTGATPLAIVKEGVKSGLSISQLQGIPDYMSMLIGRKGGSLGEVGALALLLGFGYMLWKKVVTWHIPVSILVTVFAFTGLLWLVNGEQFANPVFHMLTGGLLLGAIFMATDYVSSPMNTKGMWIYGIGIGVITVVIRTWGAYPEGASFAIIIMNAFVPIINKYVKPKRFGEPKPESK